MIAFERHGKGTPLLMMHGTTSSRQIWKPMVAPLSEHFEVLAIDLPGHGESPATSYTPPEWAAEVAALLDRLKIDRIDAVGHSAGGWTALELAKLDRTSGVLALAPAGLWRKRSPIRTDAILNANWRLGRLVGPRGADALRLGPIRSVALRGICARPRQVSPEAAVQSARQAIAMDAFPRHFIETRRLRFEGGQAIEVPVKVIWGAEDRVAIAGKSRSLDELPAIASAETWPGCGHMLMWDAPQKLLEEIRGFFAGASQGRSHL
jgi:pimeloyl-ACP methyl ester carboxylesterase